MKTENVDRRILGAFVCIDAITGSSVVPAVPVSAPQWNVKPNRSGTYVIFNGPSFDKLTDEFDLGSDWPTNPTKFEVSLQDLTMNYLPRRAMVQAPLAVPAGPQTTPTGVFAAQKVTLYPSAASAVGPNWCVLRVSVTQAGSSPLKGLPWAVIQVLQQSNNDVLATGQTGPNGEALLAVIGLSVQPNTSGGGGVTIQSVPATAKVYFDSTTLKEPAGWIPNPDDILTNLGNTSWIVQSKAVQLSSGQEIPISFSLSV